MCDFLRTLCCCCCCVDPNDDCSEKVTGTADADFSEDGTVVHGLELPTITNHQHDCSSDPIARYIAPVKRSDNTISTNVANDGIDDLKKMIPHNDAHFNREMIHAIANDDGGHSNVYKDTSFGIVPGKKIDTDTGKYSQRSSSRKYAKTLFTPVDKDTHTDIEKSSSGPSSKESSLKSLDLHPEIDLEELRRQYLILCNLTSADYNKLSPEERIYMDEKIATNKTRIIKAFTETQGRPWTNIAPMSKGKSVDSSTQPVATTAATNEAFEDDTDGSSEDLDMHLGDLAKRYKPTRFVQKDRCSPTVRRMTKVMFSLEQEHP